MNKSILLLILAVLITGCGGNIFEAFEDQKSKESIDFQISRDADAGNWEAVLKECPGQASAEECAGAAMGLAGFDIEDVVNALAAIDSSSTTNDIMVFADIPLNPDARDELAAAKAMLLEELEKNPGDADLSYQLVMLSLVNTATWLAYGVQEVGGSISNGISKSDAQTLADDDGVIDEIVGAVAEDVANVSNDNIIAAGFSADISASITDITLGDVTNPGINYDGVGGVSADDLKNYLTYELGAE